ncbi:MAG TPA: hypothetical protein P5120_10755 [Spirochaetota bacterium]|mgnify:CR=1 FL=1|nr:hypothetical protein [Spirochaetota bacterium]HPJ44006.1 hypothetical protein [Spirochaetota bacterium]HPR38305.1 hypothetical protein [Spirochaetota bacterium]HRX47987.1 hypothetical protein [Spirochaetota bacterium]
MKKLLAMFILILISSSAFPVLIDDIQVKKVDADRLKLYPVPHDHRNYFFLQSVDNTTQIIIGDFSKNDKKKIILITLGSDFNTIKSVLEYEPDKRSLRVRKESDSQFFTKDIAKLKKDIITGALFNISHADRMKSYDALEMIFKKNEATTVLPDTYGFTVKLTEVDETNKPMALFTFGRSETGYFLQFRTEYYRINARNTVKPILRYSVYCKDTNDPVVKDLVEELFKIREPVANRTRRLEKGN